MKALGCAATRRRLDAFHDDELGAAYQIAVAAHLEWCTACGEVYRDMDLLRAVLRTAPRRGTLTVEEAATFQEAIVNRAKAEQSQSLSSRLRDAFDDMHLVYAGLGAAAAAVVCVVVMFGMLRFVTTEQPDSLAALVRVLASPGSNQNPVPLGARVSMPPALDESSFSAESTIGDEDGVFAFATVVTREGRLSHVELLRANGVPWVVEGSNEAKWVEHLLHTAGERPRFEPASWGGSPIAVNMVWIVAHTTVRGTATDTVEAPVAPKPTKRAAELRSLPPAATAVVA